MASTISTSQRNTVVDAIAPDYNAGYIRLYDGAAPASLGAITTQTKIGEFRFAATAFGAAASGVATAAAIADADWLATGTPTWVRFLASDGTTVLRDGDVGTTGSGTTVELQAVPCVAGATGRISSVTLTCPAAQTP